jgi:hypothetical protein
MELRPGDVGATEGNFKEIIADQGAVMIFYDYNELASIRLPAGGYE